MAKKKPGAERRAEKTRTVLAFLVGSDSGKAVRRTVRKERFREMVLANSSGEQFGRTVRANGSGRNAPREGGGRRCQGRPPRMENVLFSSRRSDGGTAFSVQPSRAAEYTARKYMIFFPVRGRPPMKATAAFPYIFLFFIPRGDKALRIVEFDLFDYFCSYYTIPRGFRLKELDSLNLNMKLIIAKLFIEIVNFN